MSADEAKKVAGAWAGALTASDSRGFASLYVPAGEYVDHALRLKRVGRHAIERYHSEKLAIVSDFVMTIDRVDRTQVGSIFRYVGAGTFVGTVPPIEDAVTPFAYRGAVFLTITTTGLVARSELFYSADYRTSRDVEDYDIVHLIQ